LGGSAAAADEASKSRMMSESRIVFSWGGTAGGIRWRDGAIRRGFYASLQDPGASKSQPTHGLTPPLA
jgi:hypothetical protein